MFQQVFASPAKLQELYDHVPGSQLQRKHQGLKEGDELIFQYDGNIVRIRVGERKVFPVEVAHMIVKQSTYIWPVLNGEPLSFCELVDAPNEGASNPFACPAPGCKYQAKDMQGLGRHIIAKHSPKEEKAQPQNGAIATGIANRQPEPTSGSDAAE